jgi:hypothetical protein
MRDDRDAALATTLAVEWLWLYPDLPPAAEAPLIDRVLHSPLRHELGAIGEARRAMPLDDERRRTWDAVELIVDLDAACARLQGAVEPDLLWHIRSRTASGRRNDHSQLPLDPRQISWIVTCFRPLWPARGWPSGASTGDTNPWNATEYLYSLIARLGEDTSDEAVAAIAALADAPPDGYTTHIRAVAAEQERKRVDQAYAPPSLHAIASIVNGGPPADAADLQAVMLENIKVAQDTIRGSDVDWYRGFFREDDRHEGRGNLPRRAHQAAADDRRRARIHPGEPRGRRPACGHRGVGKSAADPAYRDQGRVAPRSLDGRRRAARSSLRQRLAGRARGLPRPLVRRRGAWDTHRDSCSPDTG